MTSWCIINVDQHAVVTMKAQNITPALVKEYQGLGLGEVTLHDVISAKATGTSPAFIKSGRVFSHSGNSPATAADHVRNAKSAVTLTRLIRHLGTVSDTVTGHVSFFRTIRTAYVIDTSG